MKEAAQVRIGLLTTGPAYRPHYPNFEKLLPPGVEVAFGGLNLRGRAQSDLEGKSAEVVRQALAFSQNEHLHGMIISGAPLAVFNPGLEDAVAQTLGLPVAAPLSSSAAALRALGGKNLLVMTPFREDVNDRLKTHLQGAGFNVVACPPFEDPAVDGGTKIAREQLFTMVVGSFRQSRGSDAIYFQGASLDPIPIIQRLEDQLRVPVVASNCAMLWCLLSRLGHKYSIKGYGKLLASWPIYES